MLKYSTMHEQNLQQIKRGATKKKVVPKKTRSTKKSSSKFTSTFTINWFWLVSGILLGLIVSLATSDFIPNMVINFKQNITVAKAKKTKSTKPTNKQNSNSSPQKPKLTKTTEPKFDFYSVLPKTNNSFSKKVTQTPKIQPLDLKNTISTTYQYSIQAGSFKKLSEADALKAELLLNNFEAKIEAVKVNRHQTWYRVIVGPFASKTNAIKKQHLLEANNIEGTIVLRHAK